NRSWGDGGIKLQIARWAKNASAGRPIATATFHPRESGAMSAPPRPGRPRRHTSRCGRPFPDGGDLIRLREVRCGRVGDADLVLRRPEVGAELIDARPRRPELRLPGVDLG